MSDLFERYYSSVHVCYVPLEGYGQNGSSDIVMQQVERLRRRILSDSVRVQQTRAKNWIRFDARLFLMAFRYAFKHLASWTAEPFDFNVLRQQATLPESTEVRISTFLNLCLSKRIEANFMYASEVIASSLVRHALKIANTGGFPFFAFGLYIRNVSPYISENRCSMGPFNCVLRRHEERMPASH
jgi:hypothetical protein